MEIPNGVIIGFVLGGVAIPTGLIRVVWTLLNSKIESGDRASLKKIESGNKALIEKIDNGHTALLEKMSELFNDTEKCEKILHTRIDALADNSVNTEHCMLKERLAINRFDSIEKESETRFKTIDAKMDEVRRKNDEAHNKLEKNDRINSECLTRMDKSLAILASGGSENEI